MQPQFVRVNEALHATFEYYSIGRISNHIARFAGGLNLQYLDTWYKHTYECHKEMEEEIHQVIHTTTANTQVYFFDTLRLWLSDWRLKEVNIDIIQNKIDNYNEQVTAQFEQKVKEELEKFQGTEDYKNRTHLDKYEKSYHDFFLDMKVKRTETYYKFYCINEKPELIDTDYLPDYISLVTPIFNNIRNIIARWVSLYEQGKIVPQATIIYERSQLPSSEAQQLPPAPHEKLKVNLSVPQLAYLFRLLYELKPDIFDIKSKTELYRFISDNFITKGVGEGGISLKNLNNQFTTPEKNTAKYWAVLLRMMLERARKE